jgi:hypothetical protein
MNGKLEIHLSRSPSKWLPCLLALALASGVAPVAAQTAEDPREVEARALFARGEYKQALEEFSRLYAEKPDPIYLRNIGRCYHKLRDAQHAIDAYRDYLRLGTLDAEERAEVEGYIGEMEHLRRQHQPDARPDAGRPPPIVVVSPPRTDEQPPLTRRWWFWTGAGAVLLGAVTTAIVLSAGGGSGRPACPPGVVCR